MRKEFCKERDVKVGLVHNPHLETALVFRQAG